MRAKQGKAKVERRALGLPTRRLGGRLGGRFGEVEIAIDGSLVVLLATLVTGLGLVALPRWEPGWSMPTRIAWALGAGIFYALSIVLHELPHLALCRQRGVRVDRLTLLAFGGVAQGPRGGLSPPDELRAAWTGPLLSAFVGGLALMAGLAFAPAPSELAQSQVIATEGPLLSMLFWLGAANLVLAGMSIMPGVPPDGGRLLRAVLRVATGDEARASRWATGCGVFVGLALMGLGMLVFLGIDLPVIGGGLSGLGIVLGGWFVVHAARASGFRHTVENALDGFRARDVMRSLLDEDVEAVSAEANVFDFVHNYALPAHDWTLPVLCAGDVVGLVSLPSARQLEEREWTKHQVREIMVPLSSVRGLAWDADAGVALEALQAQNVDQLPVIENEKVLGLVRREDVLHWLSDHTDMLHEERMGL